jgi:dihydrofolate reductase
MKNTNIVYIAKSLDGYISDRNNGLDWLNAIPNPDQIDMGFFALMDRIDALVMGRNTIEVVMAFDGPWPYTKPVYVLSNTLTEVPEKYEGKIFLVKGSLTSVLEKILSKGHHTLYIDGGKTIQSFLAEDLIDEMILTTIPILLGGGARLFDQLPQELSFHHIKSEVFLNAITQDTYRRPR